jgi:UPF0755 protein
LVLLVVAGYGVFRWGNAPYAPQIEPAQSRPVTIPEGASFRQIATLLEREHLIKSQWVFRFLGRMTGSDRRIVAGEYALHPGMTPSEVLHELVSGRVVLYSITIPEGYTIDQMAEVFGQKGLADPKEFRKLAHDPAFAKTLHLEATSLEGYLFPNTYRFAKRTRIADILRTMVEGFWGVLTPALQARAKDLNMTVHQVLTLASVVEKETGAAQERELVAGVFHNRLRRHIPLQSDPTVIYGLTNFDGNIRKKDLSSASPYNTYRIQGLPPGPIANPGAGAIRATLYPTPTPYLYFVSRNDGTHEFSATLEDHNRAVDRYQRRPSSRVAASRHV